MRAISNFDTGFPNMRGAIPTSAATLAEVLRENEGELCSVTFDLTDGRPREALKEALVNERAVLGQQ